MAIKTLFKQIFTGITIPQEYVCVDRNTLDHGLSILAIDGVDASSVDVTGSHLFLGYKPLVFGLVADRNSELFSFLTRKNIIRVSFRTEMQAEIATLSLKKIKLLYLEENAVFLFEGINGSHRFLGSNHQRVNSFRRHFGKQRPGNVTLEGNLYDQVRIAYSIPRTISVITLFSGGMMNMFPTDLHGPVGKACYLGSLRIRGVANDQVERYEKIVISEVDAASYDLVYSLGKNHMKELRAETDFELYAERSATLGVPLPASVIHYRELCRRASFDYGIHRIHIYDVIHERTVNPKKSVLAHIHQYYAQWREDHGIETKYLLR